MIKCITPLTKREKEIYDLLVECKSTKEISELLTISIPTTRTHIEAIFGKTLVNSQKELIYKHYKTVLESKLWQDSSQKKNYVSS